MITAIFDALFGFLQPALFWGSGAVAGFFIAGALLSRFLFQRAKKHKAGGKRLAEKEALLEETSGIEEAFFSGRPDFKKLFALAPPKLTQEEQNFLDGPVEKLCRMSKEWDLIQRKKLLPSVEDFLKKEKFFGLLIPKKYGGAGFSQTACARVIEKLASCNIPLSVIVMTPNSLGPAKLLLKYGAEEQKNKHLPRLARGDDLPCFALTEEQAGSDAASLQSEGILFKEKGELKIRLNFKKRWISLGACATCTALAVQIKDPEKLYSNKEHLGISCVLVSMNSSGIKKPLFHDTMGIPFYNASLRGEAVDVFAKQAVIGGLQHLGKGWRMIQETLAEGRGISLPALASACGKRTARLTGDYSFVRRQFGRPIDTFEAVRENLAITAGLSYMISAAQNRALSDLNHRPSSTVSALAKYHLTETARKAVQKGMDIMAGAGLSLGPKNKIAPVYMALPLAVTVEGANSLIQSFIVYGQGLMAKHAPSQRMMKAVMRDSFLDFYFGFLQGLGQCFYKALRAFSLSLTGGFLSIKAAFLFSKEHRYLQKLTWATALFAFLNDMNVLVFGKRLKTKGQLCGCFSDILANQYTAGALLWLWQWHKKLGSNNKNSNSHLWSVTKWGLDHSFCEMQKSFEKALRDYPSRMARLALRPLFLLLRVQPLGLGPASPLSRELAKALRENGALRQKLFENMYHPKDPEDIFRKLDTARALSLKEEQILRKIQDKTNTHRISAQEALKTGLLSPEEKSILKSAKQARATAIQVSAWTKEDYFAETKKYTDPA